MTERCASTLQVHCRLEAGHAGLHEPAREDGVADLPSLDEDLSLNAVDPSGNEWPNADGAMRIAEERRRQSGSEGYMDEDDDCHDHGELALAACCYAAPVPLYRRRQFTADESDREVYVRVRFEDPWPWGPPNDRRPQDPTGAIMDPGQVPVDARIRLLEKAGALIAAEIDRLLRTKGRAP
jgi:hypothetical protein